MADTAPPKAAPRINPRWVLTGIVIGFAAINTATAWLPHTGVRDEIEAVVVGFWGFEPMLFAIWAALGPGRFIIRTPMIVLCLALVVVAPGLDRRNFAQIERFEFVVFLITAFAMFAATTFVLMILKLISGWRIELTHNNAESNNRHLQFDIKYLISLITLCALALGITFNLKFKPTAAPPLFFGPNFFIAVMTIGGTIVLLLHLPVLAIPLRTLAERTSRKFYWRIFALWLSVTLGVELYWTSQDGEQATPYPFLIQFGGAVAAIAAAWPLRWAGCRLVTRNPALPLGSNS